MSVNDLENQVDSILIENGAIKDRLLSESKIFGEIFSDPDNAFDAMAEIEDRFCVILDAKFAVKSTNNVPIDTSFFGIFKRSKKNEWRNFTKGELIQYITLNMK